MLALARAPYRRARSGLNLSRNLPVSATSCTCFFFIDPFNSPDLVPLDADPYNCGIPLSILTPAVLSTIPDPNSQNSSLDIDSDTII
jgi:hypothetical protein